MSEVQVTGWPGDALPTKDDLLAKFAEEDITPYTWGNPPGDRYAPHTHPYHKVIYVVHGSVRFEMPEGTVGSYYPECNVLVPMSLHDRASKTPGSKAVPVRIEREARAG